MDFHKQQFLFTKAVNVVLQYLKELNILCEN